MLPQAPGCVLAQLIAQETFRGWALAVAENVGVLPAATVTLLGEMLMTVPGTTVTVAVAVFVLSAWAMAVMVTLAGLGTVAGAVYVATVTAPELLVVLMVPWVESPPVTEFTCQVTPVFVLELNVAVNCWVRPV